MKRACLLIGSTLAITSANATYAQQPAASHAAGSGPLASALATAAASDYSAAEKALLDIRGSDRPEALLCLARIRFEQGRFGDADQTVQSAAVSQGERLAALALRGQLLAAQGKIQDAIKLLSPNKDGAGTGGRRLRLVLGELLIDAGRRAEGETILLKFADEYDNDAISSSDAEGLAMVGRAMHLLRHPKDANRAYNESERAWLAASGDAKNPFVRVETLLWRAELYFDTYDPGHAEEVLTEAAKLAPHRADVNVLLAKLKLEDAFDFEAAEKLVREALSVNPKHVGAYAVRAGVALRDMDLEAANVSIDAGLVIDPNDLELLSMRAAARFLADDHAGFETAKREIFARNKEYSHAYSIIGDFAEWEHRYDDVVSMMKEAVALDPNDAKAWAQLGLTQTRAGNEVDGIKSLETAWKADHFNVRVYNTLEMLYGRWIPQQYEQGQESLFNIRYPKDEKPILERYVPRMLGEAWGSMKTHYMFAPAAPVAIEMYLNREHFSVRTSGLPNIGIEGVCFGHVVAAMSPKSEPFNWGNVLWHELAHVFAIQLSKYHVPRWFTEGLSEYETMIVRPEWQRELDPELYLAVKKNRLPGALGMNTAFTHAEGDLDVTVAYYAASQMLAFTADQFGFPKITHALQLWGEGKTTPEVFSGAFGVSPAEYDTRYRAWELARLARYGGQYMFDPPPPMTPDDASAAAAAAPASAPSHVAYAVALLRVRKIDDARHEIDEALKIDPSNKDAHYIGYKIAASAGDTEAAKKDLEAIKTAGGDGYAVEMAFADLAETRHDKAAARASLEAAGRFDPTQVEPLRKLYDLASADKRDADALWALREVARLDQHDRRAYRLLLGALVASKRWDEAKRVGESALFVDVESADIHVNYARALSATGDHKTAAFELESALLCDAKPQDRARALALLASEKLALGDVAAARARRDEALNADPECAEARALKL